MLGQTSGQFARMNNYIYIYIYDESQLIFAVKNCKRINFSGKIVSFLNDFTVRDDVFQFLLSKDG